MTKMYEDVMRLFEQSRVVSTDDLTSALCVKDNFARTNAIRTRLKHLGIQAHLIGHQAWVLK